MRDWTWPTDTQTHTFSLPMQRPRRSDERPHTMHSATQTSSPDLFDSESAAIQDDDTTPRASVVQPSRQPAYAFPNRTDTTAGTFMTRDERDPATQAAAYELPLTAQQVNLQNQTWQRQRGYSTLQPRGVRKAVQSWRESLGQPMHQSTHQTLQPSQGALESSSVPSQGIAKPVPSGTFRRLSRKYKDELKGLKDGVRDGMIMSSVGGGRQRRSSTPNTLEGMARRENPVPAFPPPTSPSKRIGRHDHFTQKKARHNLLNFADRKDTPAPANQNARPQTHLPILPNGGEAARRAAAASSQYNSNSYQPTFTNPFGLPESQEDLTSRRSRIGSCSEAADSGAELSTYYSSDGSCDGDVDMLAPDEEQKVDFLQRLPEELSLNVLECLDNLTLTRAQQVSKHWNALSQTTSVWRQAYLNSFARPIHTDPAPVQVGGEGIGRPNQPNQDWQKMYKARKQVEANWRLGPKESGKAVYLSGHTDSVYCLQFDEDKIITGSRDRTIRVWDINTFQCTRVIGGPNVKPTMGPKVLRTVDYPSFHMATASVNGTNYGNNIFHVPSQWHDASILCLQYDHEILVTGSSDSDLLIWDINTYEPIKRLRKHTGGVLDVALDAKHIVSCSKDSQIIVWSRETLEPLAVLNGHRGPVNAVQLRGNYLVSASGDGIARLWDLRTMKLAKQFEAKDRGLAAVEFSEDMKHVLAGGNDHITYKFEVETGREVAQFTGHTQLVRSLWLDSANKRVVSGSYDLDLRVYDFDTAEEIWRAEEWTTSWMLAAKSDYRRIVATSQDGRILIIDFGLIKGGYSDGQPIDGVELLRSRDLPGNVIRWRPINY
ncbi:hypothetical protein MBLNU230_g0206t1 [Neophaeotheca triangularis]